jgi:hypothetical protein
MLRWTIVQTETPDHLRGRVTSINNMSVTSGPRLGDIRATTVASLIGAQGSVISGGLLCLAGAVLTVRAFPNLMSHRVRLRRHESDLANEAADARALERAGDGPAGGPPGGGSGLAGRNA